MPKTTTVVAKSFAALLATGLGTLGGYNYVSGGNVWGTGNDYPALPAPTSISAVANSRAVAEPQPGPSTPAAAETNPAAERVAPEATEATEPDAAETDGSCCTSTGRAGFLTGTEAPAPTDEPTHEPAADEG